MELIILGLFLMGANYMGYRMGKGDPLNININKFKPVIRNEEQEQKLVEKLTRSK